MSEAVREDPPPPSTRVGAWIERLQAPLNDPGEWYRVFETDSLNYAGTAVVSLRKREYKIPDPEGEWEFTARGQRVYARYGKKPVKTPRKKGK